MNLFRANKYLRYSLLSGHRKGHGIHSPFVYDLVSRIFHNKMNPAAVTNIEKLRSRMLNDQRTIEVNDLGSGSSNLKFRQRKVSDIARYSPVPKKYGILLSNMAAEFGAPRILELGTSLGISALYLASACPAAVVTTIEGCQAISEIASSNFKEAGVDNINLITGPFDDVLPSILNEKIKPALVFIDGNHQKMPLLKYFNSLSENSDDTVIIIDDIYNSREMEQAWIEIKRSEKVTLTVDIFRMGLVFFRKGVTPGNYIIRYS
jgi:predicted O-methyltransferase YrrM